MTETETAIERLRAHVEKNAGKVQAPFSIAGLKTLLAELEALREAVRQCLRILNPVETMLTEPEAEVRAILAALLPPEPAGEVKPKPVADADGWTAYAGKSMPVKPDTLVDVRFKDSVQINSRRADYWNWLWAELQMPDNHIIAYRLSEPKP